MDNGNENSTTTIKIPTDSEGQPDSIEPSSPGIQNSSNTDQKQSTPTKSATIDRSGDGSTNEDREKETGTVDGQNLSPSEPTTNQRLTIESQVQEEEKDDDDEHHQTPVEQPRSSSAQREEQVHQLGLHPIDLPSLTPSKSNNSTSDSESDSIPDGFTDINDDDDEDGEGEDDEERENEGGDQSGVKRLTSSLRITNLSDSAGVEKPLRTPSNLLNASSLITNQAQQNSFSEPGPNRSNRLGRRKRSLSELVALRYRGGKGESEIGDEERGLLALDLGAYINSGDPDLVPETKPIPPSGLFPTLENLISNTPPQSNVSTTNNNKATLKRNNNGNGNRNGEGTKEDGILKIGKIDDEDGDDDEFNRLPKPPPRSEWPFGGTGPGKTSRGFIPGRRLSKPT